MLTRQLKINKYIYAAALVAFWLVLLATLSVMMLWGRPDRLHFMSGGALLVLSLLVSLIPLLLIRGMERTISALSAGMIEPQKLLAEKQKLESFLLDISNSLSSSLSKERLIRLILNNMVAMVECEVAFLLLYNDKTERYDYEAGFRMDRTMLRAVSFAAAMDPLLARVVRDREVVIFDDIRQIDAALPFTRGRGAEKLVGVTSMLVVPLVVEERVLGVLEFFCAKDKLAFVRDQFLVCSIAFGQASIAIGSAVQSGFAILDRKTMLYNHEYFISRFREEISRSMRYNQCLSMLMIDIDFFKKVNDTYGHQAGDAVLKDLSCILRDNTRLSDIAARFGGEEFSVLLPGCSLKTAKATVGSGDDALSFGGAFDIAEKLRKKVEEHKFMFEDKHIPVTISIGLSSWDPSSGVQITEDGLVEAADQNLYRAKQEGRNRVCA